MPSAQARLLPSVRHRTETLGASTRFGSPGRAREAMVARYYFDIHKDGVRLRDTEGTECNGSDAIRQEAMHTLPLIAKDAIPMDGDRQAFTVLVRDENGMTVYTATLTFAGLWVGDIPPSEPAANS